MAVFMKQTGLFAACAPKIIARKTSTHRDSTDNAHRIYRTSTRYCTGSAPASWPLHL